MFRRPLALLLLVAHVNFFMCIAQVDEVDAYTPAGQRINDINSLAEYINDVVLKHNDKNREDEDDDNARYFHMAKVDYNFSQPVTAPCSKNYEESKSSFPLVDDDDLHPVYFEVITPPPRVC